MMKRALKLSFLAGLFACLGCADPAPDDDVDAEVDAHVVLPDTTPADSTPEDADVEVDAEEDGDLPERWELQIQGREGALIHYGQRMTFTVKLTSAKQVIPGRKIKFTMLQDGSEKDNIFGTYLSTKSATTNDEGLASVDVIAGDGDTTFRLEARNENTAPVYFEVAIAREGAGLITVRAHYCDQNQRGCVDGSAVGRYKFEGQINQAQAHIIPNMSCDALLRDVRDGKPLPQAFETIPIKDFNELNNVAVFSDLDNQAEFAVLAVGQHKSGDQTGDPNLAAACEKVTVVGGENQLVDLILNDLPLQLKGTYTVKNRFNLTQILQNLDVPALKHVARVLEIFRLFGCSNDECPGRADDIINIICEFFGENASVCQTFKPVASALFRILDGVLFENDGATPTAIAKVFQIISDVLNIAGDMTTIGEIEFRSNPDANGEIAEDSDDRWQQFLFTWHNNCPSDCTRSFSIGAIEGSRDMAGTFKSSLSGMNLKVEDHSFTFKYGKILLGIVEKWVFPRFIDTGSNSTEVSFEEMLEHVLPCEKINGLINKDCTGDDCICQGVLIPALTDVVTQYIEMLEFEGKQFRLSGDVELVDDNYDLKIDYLKGGVWHGVLQFGENAVPLSFNGCFAGCSGKNIGIEECLHLVYPNVTKPDCEIPGANQTKSIDDDDELVEDDSYAYEE